MDFLDSLDLDTTNRRSHRVRSWYLYEQYKSLERNQLQAAQKLKDKSYQDRILQQELSERKARRKIYDQFGLCHSESRLERSIQNTGNQTELSVSADDFFESVCELQDGEEELHEENVLSEDTFSEDDSLEGKCYIDELKTVEGIKDDSHDVETEENLDHDGNIIVDLKKVLKADINVARNIHLQLEEVKENIQCIERCAKLVNDKISEDEGSHSDNLTRELKSKRAESGDKTVKEFESNLFMVWTKLVSFAYQIMQLNHGNGNCYYDYSSQFLTAVLACDVLRRGVSRMCHILQPYVSPIKYATDESDASVDSCNNANRKKSVSLKDFRKSSRRQSQSRCKTEQINTKIPYFNRKFRSEEHWRRLSKNSLGNNSNRKCKRASEPWRSVSKLYTIKREVSDKSSTSSSIWPEFSKEDVSRSKRLKVCDCCWRREVEDPMMRIARYMDSMLKELEECNRK